MAFSQISISDVRVVPDGSDLLVVWFSTAPARTTFQVYVDRKLAWYGVSKFCHVPIPAGALGRNIWIEVGTVGSNQLTNDYSSNLITPGGRTERARLSWLGGTYLDPTGKDNIRGFQVYQSPSPNTSLNMTSSVDTIIAYPGGWINDGFGKSGFGGGGFGRAATTYNWQSPPLRSGVWQFAVVPFDMAGNTQGVVRPVAVTISAAPRPPAMNANRSRLTSAYAGTPKSQLTLNWLPSPSE